MRGWDINDLIVDVAPQCPYSVLAMPARRPAQRIEDATLLHPSRRPVALRNRRQNLPPPPMLMLPAMRATHAIRRRCLNHRKRQLIAAFPGRGEMAEGGWHGRSAGIDAN